MKMEAIPRVLIVDKGIDRKKRIAALKQRGFSVFPALQLGEARSRCRPGAYDLVIVNAQDEPEMARAFCDELCGRTPAQPVLLVVSGGSKTPERAYAVADDPEVLAQRAEELVGRSSKSEEGIEQPKREDAPTRASA